MPVAELEIHKDDTNELVARLPPRDDDIADIYFRVGDEDTITYDAIIEDQDKHLVAVPLSSVDWTTAVGDEGIVLVEWEIVYENGTTEILPKDGTYVEVFD